MSFVSTLTRRTLNNNSFIADNIVRIVVCGIDQSIILVVMIRADRCRILEPIPIKRIRMASEHLFEQFCTAFAALVREMN